MGEPLLVRNTPLMEETTGGIPLDPVSVSGGNDRGRILIHIYHVPSGPVPACTEGDKKGDATIFTGGMRRERRPLILDLQETQSRLFYSRRIWFTYYRSKGRHPAYTTMNRVTFDIRIGGNFPLYPCYFISKCQILVK